MKNSVVLFLLCNLFILGGCYKDKFRALHPDMAQESNICDSSSTVSYSKQIVPIINNYCINCHGANATMPDLSMYSGVKSSTQTNFYGSVVWDGSASLMPKNASSRIPICELVTLKRWISVGAPNN